MPGSRGISFYVVESAWVFVTTQAVAQTLLDIAQGQQIANQQQANEHESKEKIMSALLTMRTCEATGYKAAAVATVEKSRSAAKNIALFLVSPFIGLLYLVSMPVVGFAALAWVCGKALAAWIPALRTIALLIAAPCIGLVFIVALPVLGMAALITIGAKGPTAG